MCFESAADRSTLKLRSIGKLGLGMDANVGIGIRPSLLLPRRPVSRLPGFRYSDILRDERSSGGTTPD